MKKVLAILLASALLTGTMAGCSAKSSNTTQAETTTGSGTQAATQAATEESSGELTTIRVAVLNQQLALPIYYIQTMGWDVENGFKLDISTFAQGSGINEALGSGLVDVFTIGAAAISSCCTYDAVYLFSHEDSGAGQQFMVRGDSDIAATKGYLAEFPDVYGTPETIRDTTFLLPMGTAAQILADVYLDSFGLSEDDVTLVNMSDDATAYQAFVSGQGDFAKTSYPSADNYTDDYVNAFSMNSMNVPYYDNILCSRAFFDNADNHDALVALCEQIIRAADAFKDEKLLMDTMMAWYDVCGVTADASSIEHQVLERPFFTYEDLTSIDSSASFKLTAEFYAVVGNISDSDLEKVYANMDSTILDEALEAFAADYRK